MKRDSLAVRAMLAMIGDFRLPAPKPQKEPTQADRDRLEAAQAKRDRKQAKRSKRK